ncbi:uncharacterized protein LOC126789459 [Argentina anserina]|uniref:uncharacterized protein LOC126789459 n=1 Tax=Argentina anserina TaxID=57926 RepID=UPI00217664AE|nr:uncharacterized protein LOC126789459 [Potentilla anserina]
MAFVSFPVITNNPVYRNTMHISYVNPAYTIHKSQPWIQRWHRELLVLPISCAKDSPEGAGGEDHQPDPRALETLLKLYNAMKNKNIVELSEIIADEPECVGNLSSIVQPLRGKKVKLSYRAYNLIGHLGSEIEFFVKPTLHDGMKVGLQWGVQWNKTRMPFGKGFSFYTSHHYKGKVAIK